MKKTAVLILAFALLTLSVAIVPAVAIGPSGAVDNDNPNFTIDAINAIHNFRGEASGQIIWTPMPVGQPRTFWSEMRLFDATSGEGKIKNAIAAWPSTFGIWSSDITAYGNGQPTVNENKWIFLSPDGSGNQYAFGPSGAYGIHGMVWYWLYISYRTGGFSGPDAAAMATVNVAQYPEGLLWKYNFIG